MKIIIVALILTVLLSSNNVVACPPGSGSWVLSSGVSECRICPTTTDPPESSALKMPEGCLVPFPGALLDPDFYIELKDSTEYAVSLENWRLQLSPTLEALQAKIEVSNSRYEDAVEYNTRLQLDLSTAQAMKIASDRSFWVATIAGSSVALVLATALVLSSQ